MKSNRILGALTAAVLLASPAPARADEQANFLLPDAGPHSMADLVDNFINPALRAIASCHWGAGSPTNGPSGSPILFQCWANTTTNPVLIERWDGAQWVVEGALNTSTHVWTPYRNGAAIVAVATSGSASDLTTGTLPPAQLPNPSAATLGGTQSKTCGGSNWLNAISTSGVPGCSQPSFSDLLGTIAPAQIPNPSATTLGGVESKSCSASNWLNQISTSGVPACSQPGAADLSDGITGTGTVVRSVSPTLTGTPAAPTASPGTNSTQLSTTAYADAIAALKANAARNISTGCGLTGGGDLSADRTLKVSFTINGQTGTSYLVVDGDCGKLVSFTNASPVAVTLPQANGSTFVSGWTVDFVNKGAGAVTITPTTSTINGNTNLVLNTNQGAHCDSDGSNYTCVLGVGAGGGSGTVTNLAPGAGLVSSTSAACSQTAITSTGTVSVAECVDPRSTTTETINDGDRGKLITGTNASAQAYSLAQAGASSSFVSGWFSDIANRGTGNITITPTTSTINGKSSWILYPGQSTRIVSDGTNYQLVSAPALTSLTTSLGADVALSSTGSYFDGPSVAQGTVGTWLVSGTVTLVDTATAANLNCKMWDGATVFASVKQTSPTAAFVVPVSLSGTISNPAGNIKISCQDTSTTSGAIKFNSSGNSKDSTITAVRIN